MTEHSEYGGLVDWPESSLANANEPVNAGWVRDNLVNNVAHYYDSATQPRVTYNTPTGGTPLQPDSPSTTQYQPVAMFGTAVTIRQDGQSCEWIIRLGVAVASAGTGTWLVWLHPKSVGASHGGRVPIYPPTDTTRNDILTFSTTSTSPTYVNPSQALIVEAPEDIDEFRGLERCERDSIGGDMDQVITYEAVLGIWAKTSTGVAVPELYSVQAREFIG